MSGNPKQSSYRARQRGYVGEPKTLRMVVGGPGTQQVKRDWLKAKPSVEEFYKSLTPKPSA